VEALRGSVRVCVCVSVCVRVCVCVYECVIEHVHVCVRVVKSSTDRQHVWMPCVGLYLFSEGPWRGSKFVVLEISVRNIQFENGRFDLTACTYDLARLISV